MGGVDVSDQRREYYGVGRSSKKWWKFILHFVLNVCLVNCFILYDLTNHPPCTAHGNRQLTFRWNLVHQLICTFTSSKRTGRKRSSPIRTAFPNFSILYKKYQAVQKCVLCVQRKRKKLHPEGVNRQHINVSSVTFHCAMWGVFWNTMSSEMWRCKIRQVGYYHPCNSTGKKFLLDVKRIVQCTVYTVQCTLYTVHLITLWQFWQHTTLDCWPYMVYIQGKNFL